MDRRAFWERKILAWEAGRYDLASNGGVLEQLADRASDSLRFRIAYAAELLAPIVPDKRVVDLGCGSGLLAPPLLEAGAASYLGVDLAEAAVVRARARAEELGLQNARFERGDAEDDTPLEADVVVSLGLTDWLDDEALDRMFARSGSAEFLHAISELRHEPSQWLHRAYCWIAYGWRTRGYVPRYFDPDLLAERIERHRPGEVYLVRHPRLSFGAFVTSLPLGERIG